MNRVRFQPNGAIDLTKAELCRPSLGGVSVWCPLPQVNALQRERAGITINCGATHCPVSPTLGVVWERGLCSG